MGSAPGYDLAEIHMHVVIVARRLAAGEAHLVVAAEAQAG